MNWIVLRQCNTLLTRFFTCLHACVRACVPACGNAWRPACSHHESRVSKVHRPLLLRLRDVQRDVRLLAQLLHGLLRLLRPFPLPSPSQGDGCGCARLVLELVVVIKGVQETRRVDLHTHTHTHTHTQVNRQVEKKKKKGWGLSDHMECVGERKRGMNAENEEGFKREMDLKGGLGWDGVGGVGGVGAGLHSPPW